MSEDYLKMMEELQKQALQQSLEMQQKMMGNSLSPEMLEAMQQNAQFQMDRMADLQSNIQDIFSGEADKKMEEFIAQHPQPEELKKYLALGSFFVNMRAEPMQTLELMDDMDYYKEECEKGWSIMDKGTTTVTIEGLLESGHYALCNDIFLKLKAGNYDNIQEEDLDDYQETCSSLKDYLDYTLKDIQNCPSIKAWDLERAAYLARVTSYIGYITQEEAWNYLKRIGEETKKYFTNWKDYAISVVMGRAVSLGYDENYFYTLQEMLLDNPEFLEENPIENF